MKTLTILLALALPLFAQEFHDPGPAPSNRILVNYYDGANTNQPPSGWPSGTKLIKPRLKAIGTNTTTGDITNVWMINTSAPAGWTANMTMAAYKTQRIARRPIYDAWQSNLTWSVTTFHTTNTTQRLEKLQVPWEQKIRDKSLKEISAEVDLMSGTELQTWLRRIVKRELMKVKAGDL